MAGACLTVSSSCSSAFLVGRQLRSRFAGTAAPLLSNGMSGKEIAERMLADHGITNEGDPCEGQLTDHYNPPPART